MKTIACSELGNKSYVCSVTKRFYVSILVSCGQNILA